MKALNSNKAGQDGQGGEDLSRLLKPLRLELKQGCLDKAVSGGLAAYVLRWGGDLGGRFKGYATLAVAPRQALVRETLESLEVVPAVTVRGAGRGDPAPTDGRVDLGRAPVASRIRPSDPVASLSSLGPKRAAALRSMGIHSVEDLLYHSPRAWQDRSRLKPIAQLVEGEIATVQGRILSSANFRTRSRLTITEVAVQDDSATLFAVYFNQPFQQRRFKAGEAVVLSGTVGKRAKQWQMSNPEAEVLPAGGEETLIHTGRIVPLYSLAKELSQRVFRAAVWQALPALGLLEDPLPPPLVKAQGLQALAQALRTAHFPEKMADLEPARIRLAFDELFLLSLALEDKKRREQAFEAPRLDGGGLAQALLKALPFALTKAQARVWQEIQADLAAGKPMRRLVQGDVGSGKTILAALGLAAAVDAGWQGALMAPTEILAEQHLKNLRHWLGPLGVEVLSLTQAQKGKGRKEVLAHLASGRPLVAVGTQALIQTGVEFGRLGLVVTDEQHRFGVMQRLELTKKSQFQPHSLVMTATPIPRTLAMTAYGDLDVSIVDELPPGRTPITTHWVQPSDRHKVWAELRQQVEQGRQAYVVYALVDESDKTEWLSATQMAEELKATVFSDFNVALLHGKMKPEEKDAVMTAFKAGQIQVLCSTTVVEVGVDVPNATAMVVEDADRFGLAQLHQLRGRVGRGAARSYCWLVAAPKTEEGRLRLEAMSRSNDGFFLAEEDLRLRGPGELLGTRQSGLPELRQADLLRDQALLINAKKAAQAMLLDDPSLSKSAHRNLKEGMQRRFGLKIELGSVG
jgi:ATP-dependent DNA helicase RecG